MSASKARGEVSAAQNLADSPTFRIRLGAPKSGTARPKLKSFIGRIKALAHQQGGAGRARKTRSGRGRLAGARIPVRVAAQRVTIKTRVINHGKYRRRGDASAAIQDEIAYLKRRGVSADGESGIAFDGDGSLTGEELKAFRDKMAPDRHHFRLVVSPEQGAELELPTFVRELVTEVQKDLGTKLKWFGVAHYDTDNPHVHLIVRGKDDKGKDLVISRNYISHGMRLQAGEVATRHLGPRRAEDIDHSLRRELTAAYVTSLDRRIDAQRAQHPEGLVTALHARNGDLATESERLRTLSRLQHLESLGLAKELSPGIWQPDGQMLEHLKALSLKGDIVKTIHARMTGKPWALDPLILDARHPPKEAFLGRVTARGRVDEFWDDEYLIVDTHKARMVYVPLAEAKVSGAPALVGDLVRLQPMEEGRGLEVVHAGQQFETLAETRGVTELDRELKRQGSLPSEKGLQGFAASYGRALKRRALFLENQGLAQVENRQVRLRATVLDELYAQEIEAAHERLRSRFGTPKSLEPGERWQGSVTALESLPSGLHAVIANSGFFALIPASPALERLLDRSVQLRVASPSAPSSLAPMKRQLTFDIGQGRTRGRSL